MKLATLQYSHSQIKTWDEFVEKNTKIVKALSKKGVQLILYPEYAHSELRSMFKRDEFEGFQTLLSNYLALFQDLSRKNKVYICSGTYVVKEGKSFRNRAFFFGPTGYCGFQDKCVLTPSEHEENRFAPGDSVQLFTTSHGLMGIAICYDAEFPSIVRQMTAAGAQLILVPSYTTSLHGFFRVHICCRARAIENQCYIVQSSVIGKADTDLCSGLGAIYTPSDHGFPDDGILVKGKLNRKEAVIGTVDFSQLPTVRTKGETRNYFDANTLKKPLRLSRFNLA